MPLYRAPIPGPEGPAGNDGADGADGMNGAGGRFSEVGSGSVNTVDASTVACLTVAIPDLSDGCYVFEAFILRHNKTSPSYTEDLNRRGIQVKAGVPSLLTNFGSYFKDSPTNSLIDLSGTNVVVKVTGSAAQDIDWSTTLFYRKMP